jgi:methionyl aminopeptidase
VAGDGAEAGRGVTPEPARAEDDGGRLDDGWTLVTPDGSLSAQWERTVVVTRDGYELMTQL